MSLNPLKKLTKGELSNIVIECQNRFNNMLLNKKYRTYYFKGQI